jgi:hypothetical protein
MSKRKSTDGMDSKYPLLKTLLGILVGLSLLAVGVFISIFTSFTIVGIFLGIPFIIAAIAVPYMMIRGGSSGKSW